MESQEGALEQLEQSAQEAAHRGREAEQKAKALQDSLQVGCAAAVCTSAMLMRCIIGAAIMKGRPHLGHPLKSPSKPG